MIQSDTRSAFSIRRCLSPVKPYANELQFWGYEISNLLAAIAGTGGVALLWSELQAAAGRKGFVALLDTHADVAVTLGIGVIIGWLIVARALANRFLDGRFLNVIDFAAAITGLVLIVATLWHGVNWLTASAVCFVSGSALLRQAKDMPVLLKHGGLLLALGGACLIGVGVQFELSTVNLMTALTGISVVFAGLLTYQGGIFACAEHSLPQAKSRNDAWRTFGIADRMVSWCVEKIVLPLLFWIPQPVKAEFPFLTSMWARLPFRLLLAVAALATMTTEGMMFASACLLWATGDVSIGSLDAD